MRVCVCVCACEYVYAHICILFRICTFSYTYINLWILTCVFLHIHIYIRIYIHIYLTTEKDTPLQSVGDGIRSVGNWRNQDGEPTQSPPLVHREYSRVGCCRRQGVPREDADCVRWCQRSSSPYMYIYMYICIHIYIQIYKWILVMVVFVTTSCLWALLTWRATVDSRVDLVCGCYSLDARR